MQPIHGAGIHAGFTPTRPPDLQGWNGLHPVLVRAVEQAKPRLARDVGVWKGRSAAFLAEAIRRVRPKSALVSIDTFLGRHEHWNRDRPDRIMESIGHVHGWPSLYWQFLSNMVLSGRAERVLPLAQTSDTPPSSCPACGFGRTSSTSARPTSTTRCGATLRTAGHDGPA